MLSKPLFLAVAFATIVGTSSLNAQSSPTAADAQAFMDRAESQLFAASVESQRAGWVEETDITIDTEALAAKANEPYRPPPEPARSRVPQVRQPHLAANACPQIQIAPPQRVAHRPQTRR